MISPVASCMSPSRFPNPDYNFPHGQPQVAVPPITTLPVPQINVSAPDSSQPIPPIVIQLPSPDSPIQ